MAATLETLERMAVRIKGEMGDPQSLSYEFAAEDAEYAVTLRRLPFGCDLWRRFRAYAEARHELATYKTKREQWEGELRRRRQQLNDMMQDPDALLANLDAYVQLNATIEILVNATSDPHGVKAELSMKEQRYRDLWGGAWQDYNRDKNVRQDLKQSLANPASRAYNDPVARSELRTALAHQEARIQEWERPLGG